MNPGDVVLTKAVTANVLDDDGKWRGSFGYRAPKGGHLVLLVLGVEPAGGPPLDPVAVLYELGWSSPAFPDPRASQDSGAVPPGEAREVQHG